MLPFLLLKKTHTHSLDAQEGKLRARTAAENVGTSTFMYARTYRGRRRKEISIFDLGTSQMRKERETDGRKGCIRVYLSCVTFSLRC